jgi:hypothetical protein
MSPFATKIRHYLSQYKRILKRHLSPKAYTIKVKNLHIKRRELTHTNDIDLFHIANRILLDVETWLNNPQFSASEYSGLDEFRQHFKNYLKNHSLEGTKVVNSNQQVSRLMVQCIQLLTMPHSDGTHSQLINNISLLKELGSEEALEELRSVSNKYYSDFFENL